MQNFYAIAKSGPQVPNPNESIHNIALPARILICGPSGSGKTSALLNLLVLFGPKCFHKLILCLKSADEPLYNHMIERLEPDVYEDGNVPELESYPKETKTGKPYSKCIIFDDLLYTKNPLIKNYYIYGRKSFYTSIYLSQSYFTTERDLRKNSQIFILTKGLLERDLNMITSEFIFDNDRESILNAYRRLKHGDVLVFNTNKRQVYINFTQQI